MTVITIVITGRNGMAVREATSRTAALRESALIEAIPYWLDQPPGGFYHGVIIVKECK